jgi:RibD domain-containing protein
MRKLMVTTMLSLDGVMQAPGGPEEDPSDGFAFGGWTAPFVDDQGLEAKAAELGVPFDLRSDAGPTRSSPGTGRTTRSRPSAKPLNDATKYVASRSRPSLDWGPSVLIEDAAEGVAALKQEDGPELQVHGSANLAQTLIRHGLVDEYHLWIFPVVAGEATLRRRHDPRVPAPRRLEGLRDRRVHGHLRARRRGRHGLVLATADRQTGAPRCSVRAARSIMIPRGSS